MFELVILGKNENSTWKTGKRPDSLLDYFKPGVFMVALYYPGYEGGLGGDSSAELIDFIYKDPNNV